MKILIISQNYEPMNNAGAVRITDLYNHLSKTNQVKVIAEPNTLTYPIKNKSMINRLLNYFSFGITSFIKTLFGNYNDVCIISSPSPIPLITNTLLKGIKYKKLIFDIRDIWFVSVIAYGQMKQSFITQMLDKIIFWCYGRADKIVVVTQGQADWFTIRGFTNVKVITNGINETIYTKDNKIKQKMIVFPGNLGHAYEFNHLIKAMEQLPDWVLLLVGDGVKYDSLPSTKNIIIMKSKSRDKLKYLLSTATIGVLPLKRSGLFKQVVPVKTYDYIWYDLFIIGNISRSMTSVFNQTRFNNYKQININDVNSWVSSIKNIELKEFNTNYNPLTLKYRGNQYLDLINKL